MLVCCALAQADPPTLFRVIRNATWTDNTGYSDARVAVTVLGMTATSGPFESWFLEMHDSFASIEAVDKALSIPRTGVPYSDDVLPPSTTLIALYRPNLSHRSDEAAKSMPKARYFLLSIYRIRPGTQAGFFDLVRMRRSHFESINLDQPEMAYQVMAGAPSGTFIFITPLASLKTFDDGLARTPEGYREVAAEQKLTADVEIGHEYFLFRIDPRSSYISDDFAAGDPDFWNAKPKDR
jgi:hypothetical protein